MSSAHQFALYYPQLDSILGGKKQGSTFQLQDSEIIKRIVNVLRLVESESVLLFNKQTQWVVLIVSIEKKYITCTIEKITHAKEITPHITFLLPLLKRDSLEQAVYNLVELGINTIQLVSTQKTQNKLAGQKELERLERICISACEQSKQFNVPAILPPIPLSQATATKYTALCIYADPEGQKLQTIIYEVENNRKPIILMVGPEGDLTQDEKLLLQNNLFHFCALTPTILRSWQAASLLTGIVRSL